MWKTAWPRWLCDIHFWSATPRPFYSSGLRYLPPRDGSSPQQSLKGSQGLLDITTRIRNRGLAGKVYSFPGNFIWSFGVLHVEIGGGSFNRCHLDDAHARCASAPAPQEFHTLGTAHRENTVLDRINCTTHIRCTELFVGPFNEYRHLSNFL